MSPMLRMDRFTVLVEGIEIPCERPARNADSVARGCLASPDCGGRNPAEWVLWFACGCDEPPYVLYCTFCKDVVLSPRLLLNCAVCNRTVPGSEMYRLVEPLNKAA